MIWRLLDNLLCRLVGRLLRLSPVDPRRCRHVHHLDSSGGAGLLELRRRGGLVMSDDVTVRIDDDERYPVYTLEECEPSRYSMSLTAEEHADYLRAVAEYEAWQSYIAEAHDALYKSEPTEVYYKQRYMVPYEPEPGEFHCVHGWYYAEQNRLKCLRCDRWQSEFPEAEWERTPPPEWEWR